MEASQTSLSRPKYRPGELLKETYAIRWVWLSLAAFALLAFSA